MYRIDDRISAIKELQRLLDLNQTGLFDKKTRDTVLKVQEKYNLKQTGIADYFTFTLIADEFREKKNNEWNSDYLFKPKFPYAKGDMGDNVGRINEALKIVLEDYVYEGIIPRGKYFGEDTLSAAKFLRKIFNMGSSDEIDEALMTRIMREREAIEIKSHHK